MNCKKVTLFLGILCFTSFAMGQETEIDPAIESEVSRRPAFNEKSSGNHRQHLPHLEDQRERQRKNNICRSFAQSVNELLEREHCNETSSRTDLTFHYLYKFSYDVKYIDYCNAKRKSGPNKDVCDVLLEEGPRFWPDEHQDLLDQEAAQDLVIQYEGVEPDTFPTNEKPSMVFMQLDFSEPIDFGYHRALTRTVPAEESWAYANEKKSELSDGLRVYDLRKKTTSKTYSMSSPLTESLYKEPLPLAFSAGVQIDDDLSCECFRNANEPYPNGYAEIKCAYR